MPSGKNLRYDQDAHQIIGKDAHTEPVDNRNAILKEIASRYPPYNVKELKVAISDFRSEISVLEKSIKRARGKITQYQNLIKQCEARDKEAAPYLES